MHAVGKQQTRKISIGYTGYTPFVQACTHGLNKRR
jgi:hypothetical protein